ncbi:MAG: CBS domain-containing protein [Nitrospirota bacterium]|nr:CBS domain-containing protein [Nitrospirota bacterium]MDH5586919.1 CBS domain-containing protein [Nitrospirota bacterium]MDH5774938.1 CBS domain-containing protein [Nitrospirota bacterium]
MVANLDIKVNTVGAIMTSRVVTIGMDDSLRVIEGVFRRVKFHHLVVVDEGKIVGLLSDRDFFKAISPFVNTVSETERDRATMEKRAHQIMSHHPITVLKSCPIEKAARMMLERGVSCLPVTNADHTVEGILTWKDLFKVFLPPEPDSVF